MAEIKFTEPLDKDIFGKTAEEYAQKISQSKSNKSTQIRKYYDELVMWNDKIQHAENKQEAFEYNAPFIQMMRAKVAYASGRKAEGGYLLDEHFVKMFNQIMEQIRDEKSLRYAKLFFEAVLGFRKALEKR